MLYTILYYTTKQKMTKYDITNYDVTWNTWLCTFMGCSMKLQFIVDTVYIGGGCDEVTPSGCGFQSHPVCHPTSQETW